MSIAESDATDTSGNGGPEKRPRGGVPGNSGGKKGRSGPPGHQNNLTHGISLWTTTGKLPKKFSHLRQQLRRIREQVEAAVMDATGEPLGVREEKLITSFIRHEGRARLLERRLQREHDQLSVEQYLAVLRDLSAATDLADKVLDKLQLDRNAVSPWDRLSGVLTVPQQDSPVERTSVAQDGGGHG